MPLSIAHQSFLEERGLDVETCVRFGFETVEGKPSWLSIPYVSGGRVVNHKYRRTQGDKAFRQDKDAEKVFWNIDCLRDPSLNGEPLVITEGELDAIVAIQNGFPRTVSVPDGAPGKSQGADAGAKYSYVTDEFLKLIAGVKRIILATDGDDPGANLMHDLSIRLGRYRCQYVSYPKVEPERVAKRVGFERCKDLNDVHSVYGGAKVVQLLKSSRWLRVDGVFRMSELPPLTYPSAYDIGIARLGNHFKIRPCDLSVVTGIPSHGKTTFANEVAGRMALPLAGSDEAESVRGLLPFNGHQLGFEVPQDHGHGWSVAIASFEQQPQTALRRALQRFRGRVHHTNLNADAERAIDEWIDRHFALMVPNEDEEVSIEWMLERMATAFVQFGCKLAIVDPWNEMDHVRPQGMSLTEYTGYAIKAFRRVAAKYQAHVMVLAHPTKMERRKDGTLPVPDLYDVSDSAHWYNKPDAGITIYREAKEGQADRTMIWVQKTRSEDIGEPDRIYGKLLRNQGRFEIEVPAAELTV